MTSVFIVRYHYDHENIFNLFAFPTKETAEECIATMTQFAKGLEPALKLLSTWELRTAYLCKVDWPFGVDLTNEFWNRGSYANVAFYEKCLDFEEIPFDPTAL